MTKLLSDEELRLAIESSFSYQVNSIIRNRHKVNTKKLIGLINQQVIQALERARDEMRIANIHLGVHGISHLKVLTEPVLEDLIKEYRGDKG